MTAGGEGLSGSFTSDVPEDGMTTVHQVETKSWQLHSQD